MSRADSGIIFTGSRADTPEPPETDTPSSTGVEQVAAPTEEATTAGGKVWSGGGDGEVNNEDDKLTVIPEESSLGVGAEESKSVSAVEGRDDLLLAAGVRLAMGVKEEVEEVSVEEGEGGSVEGESEEGEGGGVEGERRGSEEGGGGGVEGERRGSEEGGGGGVEGERRGSETVQVSENLSENPETGQSEVLGETAAAGQLEASSSQLKEEDSGNVGVEGAEISVAEAIASSPSSTAGQQVSQLGTVSDILYVGILVKVFHPAEH